MSERYISPLVIRRLPKYHRCLKELQRSGVSRVSSSVLASNLGFTASQVRQDFSCFGGFGQQGYGYNVSNLLSEIASIIGVDKKHTAAIIGVGHLGHALINNFSFKTCGFELAVAFDANPELIGTTLEGVEIRDIKELDSYFDENPFDVAVLTMPREFAHDIASKVANLGVRGIWNFTNVDLSATELGVEIENVHFADSLKILCYEISKNA